MTLQLRRNMTWHEGEKEVTELFAGKQVTFASFDEHGNMFLTDEAGQVYMVQHSDDYGWCATEAGKKT